MVSLKESVLAFKAKAFVVSPYVVVSILLGIYLPAFGIQVAAQALDPQAENQMETTQIPAASASAQILETTTATPILETTIATEVQEASTSATFIFEKPELQDDIAETKRTLNGQLAEYRQLDQEFTILKGQFVKLNTLSSLEAAVQATRMVQEKRNQVLATYLSLLKLETNSLSGIKPEYAEYLVSEIETLEQALLRHTDQVRLSLDRSAINKASADFIPVAQQVQNTIEFSRSLLQLARYQALFDSTIKVLETIYTPDAAPENTNEQQVIVTPQDQRAFEQILDVMAELEQELNKSDALIQNVVASGESPKGGIDIETSVSRAYGSFTQALRYMDELLGVY